MIRKIVSILLFIIFSSSYCNAELRNVSIELSYSGVASYYNLYKNGLKVGIIEGNLTTKVLSMDIDTTIDNTFLLTAVDSNNVESPQSAPYIVAKQIIIVPPPVDPPTLPGIKKLVTYEWEYNGSIPYNGFKLYLNGVSVTTVQPNIFKYSTVLEFSSVKENELYITSFDDTSESLKSNSFKLPMAKLPPTPLDLKIVN